MANAGTVEEDMRSLPAWGEWIEMPLRQLDLFSDTSLPAWGEWIEIRSRDALFPTPLVSPRMGRVD